MNFCSGGVFSYIYIENYKHKEKTLPYQNLLSPPYFNMNKIMNTTIKRLPTHPGDVLKEELEFRGITQKSFAEATGISYTMLNEILNAKRQITSDIALVAEAALGG